MNFKINNINFNARYNVYGKQKAEQTNDVYEKAIDKLENQRRIATQAQEYLETPQIQAYIKQLPDDTFVRLHTGIIDREGKREDEILDSTPFISFETPFKNEQINLWRQFGGDSNEDSIKLSLNEFGVLDKKSILNWFDELIEFYCHQK